MTTVTIVREEVTATASSVGVDVEVVQTPVTVEMGVSTNQDHNTLFNLATGDPHPQYLTQMEADARYLQTVSESFLDLTDTPNSYTSASGYTVQVKGDLSGLEFVPFPSGGTLDHGDLLGLLDDDHPQYLNVSRADLLYSQLGHTHPFSNITSTPTTLAGYGITDDFSRAEADLLYWPLSTDLATQAELDADFALVYTKTQSDSRFAPISVSGSVTYVGLSVPTILDVTGSPITSSGTFVVTLSGQAANKVFAGPTSGADAVPTFRSLVSDDIPNIPWSKVTSTPTTVSGYSISDNIAYLDRVQTFTKPQTIQPDNASGVALILQGASGQHIQEWKGLNDSVFGVMDASGQFNVGNDLASYTTSASLFGAQNAVTIAAAASKQAYIHAAKFTGIASSSAIGTVTGLYLPISTDSSWTGLLSILIGLNLITSHAGSGTSDYILGLQSQAYNTGIGLADEVWGLSAYAGVSGPGSITDLSLVHVASPTRIGTGSIITNSRGIQIENQIKSGITNTWAIQTLGGKVEINTGAATASGLIIKGAVNQSASLQEWQDVNAVAKASMSPSGILTASGLILPAQSANTFFGGPTTGASAVPAFRTLVAADIPAQAWSTITGTPTTLAGYGITNAYTKAESDARFAPLGAGGGVASGTVSYVGLTVPSFLSVAGSPITTSGTFAVTLATETANTVFAGPTSGGAATPTFRSLVNADIPFIADGRPKQGSTVYLTVPGTELGGAVNTFLPGSGRLHYMPMVVATPITVNLAFEVTTNGATNDQARVGIYNADTDWQPTTLVYDSGNIFVDSANGAAPNVKNVAAAQALTAGRYLLVFHTSSATVAVRRISGGGRWAGLVNTMGTSPQMQELRKTGVTYAAFPGTGTTWNSINNGTSGFYYFVFCSVTTP